MDNSAAGAEGHRPVLLEEAVSALAPRSGGTYVDATFGGGGYSRALLERADCRVVGVDRDPAAVARGHVLERECPRFSMLQGRFGDLEDVLRSIGVGAVDGVVADLGLSSFQLADESRGFSFTKDGPLDMRMDGVGASETAADLLNRLDEDELARIFREFGDEPDARRIARAIVRQRSRSPLSWTGELRSLVVRVKREGNSRIDPATRVFQALRIAVNDELGELERLLHAAVDLLRPGGRLVVVSFHSGEDRAVKRFVDQESGRGRARSRYLPPLAEPPARLRWVQRAVVRPSPEEVARNPRARSARMRVAERIAPTDTGCDGDDECWRSAAVEAA